LLKRNRLVSAALGLLLLRAVSVLPAYAGDDWQPISQDELKMTSESAAPGAPAIYLYRQVDRDDMSSHEYNYARIKILTEEGRKYADIELPYIKEIGRIHSIKARTIRPDGSIVNFEGKPYDKTVVKAKGVKFLAKTFTMSDVQVGSIVEYRYEYDWNQGLIYDSRWILSDQLFTKRAKFSLKPSNAFNLRWVWPVGLPAGTVPPARESSGIIRLEANNVPAFQTEDYMPPENELKYRVAFVYSDNSEKDPEKYWKSEGKRLHHQVESFVGKSKAIDQAVSETVAPGDSPEVKLQKIYQRVQQLHNTSYEVQKTEQEKKRDKLKDTSNSGDVWKHGSGNGHEITWLFLAMVRSAGFEAYPVLISRRADYFFNVQLMNSSELNDNVVLVKLNGKDVYCDPGAAFTPLGLLPWPEAGTAGLRLDKDGGSWVTTTLPDSSVTRIDRKADMRLTENGSLEGKLTVTFTGLEAIWRRVEERNEDEAERKRFLEDQIKESIPSGIEVELTNKPDWNSSTPSLVAEYDLKVPGWASAAGRRVLLPVGLFSNTEKHVFEHANRVHPIYFQFPFEKMDEVTINLPSSWQVSSLPAEQNRDGHVCLYTLKADSKNGALHLSRHIKIAFILLDTKYYGALRNFFQVTRTGDEQQVIVQPGYASAKN
jgi:hypothetical protein